MKKGFYIIYGIPGKVEFSGFQEAREQCRKVNGAGLWDAEYRKMWLNEIYEPEKTNLLLHRKAQARKLEWVIYGLTVLVFGIFLLLLVGVR